jgi:N-acetyl-gamma-glutamyl-phosphate reductase
VASIRVAVVGASGYTGAELLRLLSTHPCVEVSRVVAKRAAGRAVTDVFGSLRGVISLPIVAFDADDIASSCDVAFCALPHGESAEIVAALVHRGVKVLDLSADFRLRDEAVWRRWYGPHVGVIESMAGLETEQGQECLESISHPAAALLGQAVYGLPELHRAHLNVATLVAVPGCYPTASILAVAPLLRAGLIETDSLIIDAKSGISGAGRNPALTSHFPEVAESLRAYKIAGTHRHTPEIEQELSTIAGRTLRVMFTPHLVPMSRGILSCVYGMPSARLAAAPPANREGLLRDTMIRAYAEEPFVELLPVGVLPDTAHVRGSNRVQVAVAYDVRTDRIIALSAIDNLVKGASGQAVQCMNLMFGVAETTGLLQAAMFP